MTGKTVDDNLESPMDEKFMEYQMEKSTEGLSESSVQFTVQTSSLSSSTSPFLRYNFHFNPIS